MNEEMNEWENERNEINRDEEYSSEIINQGNIYTFESLTFPTNKMKLIYRITIDGGNIFSMQNKIYNHSNIIVLVKTTENKIFGGYTNCKIEYDGEEKDDLRPVLFSIYLNEKFNYRNDGKDVFWMLRIVE